MFFGLGRLVKVSQAAMYGSEAEAEKALTYYGSYGNLRVVELGPDIEPAYYTIRVIIPYAHDFLNLGAIANQIHHLIGVDRADVFPAYAAPDQKPDSIYVNARDKLPGFDWKLDRPGHWLATRIVSAEMLLSIMVPEPAGIDDRGSISESSQALRLIEALIAKTR